MSLLFFDGFTDVSNYRKPEWLASPFMSGVAGRDGLTGGAFTHNGGSPLPQLTIAPATTTIYVGVACYVAATALGDNLSPVVMIATSGTIHLAVTLSAAGEIQLRRGTYNGTIVATSTGTIASTAWHSFEVTATIHATTGTCVVKVDGNEMVNYSGSTGATTVAPNQLQFRCASGSRLIWDDLYVGDTVDATATQGRPNNAAMGDLKVTTLFPTGDGASSQWVGSDGNSVSNWQQVDETTVSATDYNASSVVGNRDLYALADLPASAGSVLGIRASYAALKSDAGAMNMNPLFRRSDTTIEVGSKYTLLTTLQMFNEPLRWTKPDGTVWTVSDVNGAQLGVETAA